MAAALVLFVAAAAGVAAVDVGDFYVGDSLREGSMTLGARACADARVIASCIGGAPERGGVFLVGMSVRNARRLPVTVMDISLPRVPGVSLDQVAVGDAWPAVDLNRASAFTPFTLEPDGERLIYLIEQTTPCADPLPGASLILSGMTVGYRWLATRHDQQILTPPASVANGSC